MEQRPEHSHTLALVAQCLAAQEKFEEAAEAMARSIEKSPEADFCSLHGLYLGNLERFSEAEAACRQAIVLDESHFEARNNLGVYIGKQDRWDEALDVFREAMALAPERAIAHLNVGEANRHLGNPEVAREYLQRAQQLDTEGVYTDNIAEELGKLPPPGASAAPAGP